MPSLKEIRARIASVASTRKITSAMKMVSAAKLKKTEGTTTRFLPYKNKLSEALANYLGSLEGEVSIPLAEHREVKRVALIAISSSSGLCGVYNSSVCKLFKQVYDEYAESLGAENVVVFLVGKKRKSATTPRSLASRWRSSMSLWPRSCHTTGPWKSAT